MTIPLDQSVIDLKQDLAARGVRGLALDIDETLSRTNTIYFERLFKKFGNPENLSVNDAITKYRTTHGVPYWQTDEVKAHLTDLRRDHDMHTEIAMIEGASDAICEISKHIPCVCYITARTESVRKPTQEWLDANGFPNIPLIMRPDSVDDAHIQTWKGPVLEYLYPEVVGILDDNSAVAAALSPEYKGVLFLYDSETVPDIHVRTIACPTWDAAIAAVQTYAQEN